MASVPTSLTDCLDSAGGGAYKWILRAGPQPSERHFRDSNDHNPSDVNVDQPESLTDGRKIELGLRGTEVSRITYDPRKEMEAAR